MSFKKTLSAIFRVKELLEKESELEEIKNTLNNIKPQAGMNLRGLRYFNITKKKTAEFNNIKRKALTHVHNFRRITDHGHINTDGFVFARVSDERLELSNATIIKLTMVNGQVVSQNITSSGAYFPHNFIGMTTLDLMQWSEDGGTNECRQLTNNKIPKKNHYTVGLNV